MVLLDSKGRYLREEDLEQALINAWNGIVENRDVHMMKWGREDSNRECMGAIESQADDGIDEGREDDKDAS